MNSVTMTMQRKCNHDLVSCRSFINSLNLTLQLCCLRKRIRAEVAKTFVVFGYVPPQIDIREPLCTWADYDGQQLDLMLNVNMVHISPWSATEGLLRLGSY